LRIVTGGTDTHLFLVDLTSMELTGRDAEEAMSAVGIYANRNTIPNDKKSARVTSGLRIGTPALTTRGMGPEEMETVGKLIIRTVTNIGDEAVAKEVKDEVAKLTGRFPVPGITTDNAWPLQ
jgi:glycine hydroxymethyltransferase